MDDFIISHQSGFLLFGAMGFGIAAIALCCALFLFLRYRRIRRSLEIFFAGKEGADLESVILSHRESIDHIDREIEELYTISNRIHAQSLRSVHKTAMIRFNPFGDLGGNQSFSLALLDGHHNGIVLSSLHTRGGTRIYAKEITHGDARAKDFTEEERTVVAQACNKD